MHIRTLHKILKSKSKDIKKRISILRDVSIFSETCDHLLGVIALSVKDLLVNDGDIIFSKGDESHSMFIIVDGSVKVHDGDFTFTKLGAGKIFGEFSLVDAAVRSATVTALERTELLELDDKTFYKILSNNIEITKGVLKALVNRVRDKDKLEEELVLRNDEILRQKEEIEAQRDEIETQRDEIEAQRDFVINQRDKIADQNKEITDSIYYAKRIQNAILPTNDVLAKLFPENFIFYKPRNIVSGDFYWISEVKDFGLSKDEISSSNKVIIAVADCTGHGVPGAFMSMLGIALLNEIANGVVHKNAGSILDQLRRKVKYSLQQTGKENEATDGMDAVLCMIDKSTNKIHFAGAYNPLFIVKHKKHDNTQLETLLKESLLKHPEPLTNDNHVLFEIKSDKMPIGIHYREKENFTNFEIQLQKGDTIYLFSDGYMDQFSEQQRRKYLSKNFKELLLSIQNLSMLQQKIALEDEFNRWKGNFHQIDDILVMGIKF